MLLPLHIEDGKQNLEHLNLKLLIEVVRWYGNPKENRLRTFCLKTLAMNFMFYLIAKIMLVMISETIHTQLLLLKLKH